jgi:hypothetical protein
VIEKCVDQCPGRVSVSRMNHNPCRLIDNNDGGILIEDGEREKLWFQGKRFGPRNGSRYNIVRLETGTGFGMSLIEKDRSFINQFFGLRT